MPIAAPASTDHETKPIARTSTLGADHWTPEQCAYRNPVLDTKQLSVIVRRYSSLALIAFVLLTGSGFLRAQATVGTLENLLTPFGILILIKVFAAVALGIMGLVQRRWFIARMERRTPGGPRYFWALVAAELILMGLASAVAVTLVQVDTPVPDTPVNFGSLAEGMAGQPLPAQPGISGFVTEFGFDPVWAVLCAAGTVFYLAALRRLRWLVLSWPAQRTACWTAGVLLLFYVTNGGLNVYQNFLFSAEVLLQMSLTAIIPLLLITGRPESLALRAANRRSDGSRGIREWIDAGAAGRRAPHQSRKSFHPAGMFPVCRPERPERSRPPRPRPATTAPGLPKS